MPKIGKGGVKIDPKVKKIRKTGAQRMRDYRARIKAFENAEAAHIQYLEDNQVEMYANPSNLHHTVVLEQAATREQLQKWASRNVFTDQQMQVLLQTICDTVKYQPACYEKPTPEMFYNEIKHKAPILESFAWKKLRNKMQQIRLKYLEAAEWKGKTIERSMLAERRVRNILKDIDKLSPYWDTLGDIFNHDRIVGPGVVYDTAEDVELKSSTFDSNSYALNAGELVLKFESADPQSQTLQSSSDFTTTMRQGIMEATQTTTLDTRNSNCNDLIDDNLEFIKLEPGSPQPSTSQSSFDSKHCPCGSAEKLQNFLTIKEQNLALEKEKVELEREKLTIEREKLELEKEKVRIDFELKKLALQNELELKKVEVALRVEADERLKKYELDLKSN